MTYITPELQSMLCERARPHYSDELPYHTWQHAEYVMNAASRIALSSTLPELVEKAPLAAITGAWHDVDYHLPDLGSFKNKEERSAFLAVQSLSELNEDDRMLVASGIMDTVVEKHVKDSLFGEVIHGADLDYFAADYPEFMQQLALMRAEWGNPSWPETAERTLKFGMQVIRETENSMYKILSEADADARLAAIRSNLHRLELEKL